MAPVYGWTGTDWRALKVDGSGQLSVLVGGGAATPTIYNVGLVLANTEYARALPANTRKLLVKCRGLYDIKLAFVLAGSGVIYLTIPANMAYSEDLITPAALTLYMQCATAGQIVEIVAWS